MCRATRSGGTIPPGSVAVHSEQDVGHDGTELGRTIAVPQCPDDRKTSTSRRTVQMALWPPTIPRQRIASAEVAARAASRDPPDGTIMGAQVEGCFSEAWPVEQRQAVEAAEAQQRVAAEAEEVGEEEGGARTMVDPNMTGDGTIGYHIKSDGSK
nr:hypothetical protein CFP56_33636 [Quercus suber]